MANDIVIDLLQRELEDTRRSREFNENDLAHLEQNSETIKERIAAADVAIAAIEAAIEALR